MPPPSSRSSTPSQVSTGTPAAMAQAAAAKASSAGKRALPPSTGLAQRRRDDVGDVVTPLTAPPLRVPLWSRWLLALLLILGALGALRFGLLAASGTGLQLDEAQYWHWSRDLQWGYYSKPPAIAALIAASTALFGNSVLGVKALAMVCWLLIALLLFFFIREVVLDLLAAKAAAAAAAAVDSQQERGAARSAGLASDRSRGGASDRGRADDDNAAPAAPAGPPPRALANRAGFWAALLFTTTPVAGLLGMAVTTDAPLLLCWTLASWLLWRVLRSGNWWGWVALGLVIGVGLLSKYTIAAWLPGAVVLAWQARRRRSLSGMVLTAGVVLLVCLPHLAWNADWGWPTIRHTADITTSASRSDDGGAGVSLGEFFAGQLLLIGPVLAIWLLVLAGGSGVTWLRKRLARPALMPAATAPTAPASAAARSGHNGAAATAAAARSTRSGAMSATSAASARATDPPGISSTGRADSLAATLAPARRHLLWLALPLLALGAAQAINARAQMNWTAPVVPLLCAWLALHLVAADPAHKRRRVVLALSGISLSLALTLFAAAAPTVAAALHRPWPARLDLYIRMRGWPEAYAQLRPQLLAHPGWPVMGVNRTVISHGAWLWRDLDVDWLAWHEPGPPHDHYQLTIPYDRPRQTVRVAGLSVMPPPSAVPLVPKPAGVVVAPPADISSLGEPLFVLAEGALPDQIRGRLNSVKLLQKAEVQTAPGRVLTLTLWSARLPAISPLPLQ